MVSSKIWFSPRGAICDGLFISEEAIKTFLESTLETKKRSTSNSAPLKVSDLVRITAGPLTNYEGRIAKITGQKISIEVEFVGKKTLLDNIPINTVSKVLN